MLMKLLPIHPLKRVLKIHRSFNIAYWVFRMGVPQNAKSIDSCILTKGGAIDA